MLFRSRDLRGFRPNCARCDALCFTQMDAYMGRRGRPRTRSTDRYVRSTPRERQCCRRIATGVHAAFPIQHVFPVFPAQEIRLKNILITLALASSLHALYGQTASSPQPSSPTVTAVIRERTNATQWFSATPEDEVYGHQDSLLRLSLTQRVHNFDYMLDLGQSAELALPTDAVSPVAAQGQLGLGASYYAANNNNAYPAEIGRAHV